MKKSILIFTVFCAAWFSYADPPASINYQGRLLNPQGGQLSGVHTLLFSLFQGGDAETTTGTLVYEESASIGISGGVVNHAFGTGTSLFGGSFNPSMLDFNGDIFLGVAVDSQSNIILPRQPLESVPFALRALDSKLLNGQPGTAFIPRIGDAYVVVQTTASAVTNGINLQTAYAQAKALTPNENVLSDTNRAAVLVPPGQYDLGTGQLTLNASFVDIVGLSSAREDQFIFGQTNGPNTGVIVQLGSDVHLENLRVQSTLTTGTRTSTSNDPAAYFPSSTAFTIARNCEFVDDGNGHSWSMRVQITYSGTFTDCVAGVNSFGGVGGIASGTFTNCMGGNDAFGGGTGGLASGTFIDCSGGLNAFAGQTTASGVFTNCNAQNAGFGSSGMASGSFFNCKSTGFAFGGQGTASGTFFNCSAGNQSFGGGATGHATGTFTHCTGGNASFGGTGFATGAFTDCVGTTSSFGGVGHATGVFTNCVGNDSSFGADGLSSGTTTGGRFLGCRMNGTIWNGQFDGRMDDCAWATGIICKAGARIYGSTFGGTLNLNNTAAGVTGSRAKTITNAASNVFGATDAIALNIANSNVNP